MTKFKPTNIKGADDLFGDSFMLKRHIVSILSRSFEQHGYAEIETAQVNYLETLTYKYDANAEIVKEIYKIKDQGDRDLGLRYDLTVPFCKFIAMNRNLKMPFRRFEIGKVWRNGPVKAGRLREFYQCDIDVVGDKSIAVEAEMIAMSVEIFRQLGIDVVVEYGNRKLLTQMIKNVGVGDKNIDGVIGVVDKMKKMTTEELSNELGKFMPRTSVEKLLKAFKNPKKNDEILELENLLVMYGVGESCLFSPHLARGLNVYTGTVWEIFDKQGRISSALGGGGRYDKIITEWISNGQEYPAVGMAFGLEPIMKVLEQGARFVGRANSARLLVVPMGAGARKIYFVKRLREQGINVLVWNDTKVKKAFEYADKESMPFVTVIGEKEEASGKISIKNMQSGKSTEVGVENIEQIVLTLSSVEA